MVVVLHVLSAPQHAPKLLPEHVWLLRAPQRPSRLMLGPTGVGGVGAAFHRQSCV